MNEPPRAATGEMALAWQKEPGWGWDHVAGGGKGEELKNRRTEATGTRGIRTSGLFG